MQTTLVKEGLRCCEGSKPEYAAMLFEEGQGKAVPYNDKSGAPPIEISTSIRAKIANIGSAIAKNRRPEVRAFVCSRSMVLMEFSL